MCWVDRDECVGGGYTARSSRGEDLSGFIISALGFQKLYEYYNESTPCLNVICLFLMHAIRPCICTLTPRHHNFTSPCQRLDSLLPQLRNHPLLALHFIHLSPSLHLRIVLRQRPLSLQPPLRLFQCPCLDATSVHISFHFTIAFTLSLNSTIAQ